jgi:opine dehydrogenase
MEQRGRKMKKKITVIGCGSTGMATAAYLSTKGFAVTLCDTPEQSNEDFSAINDVGGIYIEGAVSYNQPIPVSSITNNFKDSVSDAEILLLCISTKRHKEISEKILPHLRTGQLVLFIPGNMGSVYLRREINKRNVKGLIIAEMSGNLWACRRISPGRVLVALPFSPKKIAALPGEDTDDAISFISDVVEVEKGANIIETTLNSPNIITHVGGSILNAVQIEKQGDDFALFRDGLSDVFISCMKGLEDERNQILKHLGLQTYDPPGEGLYKSLMSSCPPPRLEVFKNLKGPSSLSHRYVSEDADCGVAMLVSLSRNSKYTTHFQNA